MSKITADHLNRQAFVYVRQSTRDQLRQHHESRRRQYGLADRARQLGWGEPVTVDDDLGRSGGGSARPGFERLLVAICEGRVGIVLAAEASRLARNGRDWHTLLEFCGLVSCLLADEQTVYDPRLPNDRLLLGLQGTSRSLKKLGWYTPAASPIRVSVIPHRSSNWYQSALLRARRETSRPRRKEASAAA